ncbi:polymorphic toxin type 24 domain-containing protein, partial [Lentzea sp. NPDC004789]
GRAGDDATNTEPDNAITSDDSQVTPCGCSTSWAAHGGVETPHVQEFARNVAPDGRIFPQQSKIAIPAGPGDLPRAAC